MPKTGPSRFLELLYPELNGSLLEIRRMRPTPDGGRDVRREFCTSIQEAMIIVNSDPSYDCYFGVGLRGRRDGTEASDLPPRMFPVLELGYG